MKFAVGDLVRMKTSYPVKEAWGLVGRVLRVYPGLDAGAGMSYVGFPLVPGWARWNLDEGAAVGNEYLERVTGLDQMLELI